MLKPENALPTVAADRDGVARATGSAESVIPQVAESADQKIFLPPRSTQSRFAPPEYYYWASKSGAVPSWAVSRTSRDPSVGEQFNPRRYQPSQ
jgi:hypothetical protein